MADAFDYLYWRGDLPFLVCPINEIDGMLISRFSYAPFELLGEFDNITVKKACERFLNIPELDEYLVMKRDRELIEKIGNSCRFGGLRVSNYVKVMGEEMQFSAICVKVSPKLCYVAFRGTDETFAGWKENFNMSFISPVPSQELAVQYLEDISRKRIGKIIVGGHSKGGNLAVYASAFCKDSLKKKIVSIENFEGPGFDSKIIESRQYKEICKKIKTYVPQDAVVGMLLEHEEEYTIVKSKGAGLFQHDTYLWEVEKENFVYLETVTDASLFLDSTLKDWLREMSAEKRELLIDTLYDIILKTGASTVKELGDNWLKNTVSVIKAISGLDGDTRKVLSEAVNSLTKCAGKVLMKHK